MIMGQLKENLKLSRLVHGRDTVDYYKNNTLWMYSLYAKSEVDCQSIGPDDMRVGGFYHLHYLDESNWMKWSPIFCCDWREVNGMKLILAVNFNFIPLDIRVEIFDKFITADDILNNNLLAVDFMGMYDELTKFGFEWTIQEYDLSRIRLAHRVSLHILPRWLFSSHPKNVYDPQKLWQIWNKKLETRKQRHQELVLATLDEFYEVSSDISEKYDALSSRIKRIRRNFEKFN